MKTTTTLLLLLLLAAPGCAITSSISIDTTEARNYAAHMEVALAGEF